MLINQFTLLKSLFISFFQRFFSKPFLFIGILTVTFPVLLIIGALINKPTKNSSQKENRSYLVRIFNIGGAPRIKIQAKVEKEKVIKIVSQTSGIIANIWAVEGQSVNKGDYLAYISGNYGGGNPLFIQKQLAKTNLDHLENIYPLQIDLIGKQRNIAEKNDNLNDDLRSITNQSISETKDLFSLNEEILNSLNLNLSNYETTNSAGINNALILSTKQLKSQYQSAINSLKSSLRNLEYQTDSGKNPAGLSDLTREMTLKQLLLQEKTLNLSREIAGLQYNLAVVNEGLSYPSAPFSATVEKVHIKLGQNVNSGTILFTLSGASQKITASAYVSQKIAVSVSKVEPSFIYLKNKKLAIFPEFISSEAVEGMLYLIKFDLSSFQEIKLTDGEYLKIDLPIGYPDTSVTVPFIPIDSVFQTSNGAYVYLVGNNELAKSQKIVLGEVYGQFVEVISGLKVKDQLILDRNIISGDKIIIK